MKLIIVSGLSGSGKSIALHVLEDLDYYCIDNLPIGMLPALADQILNNSTAHYEDFAVGIDARNLSGELENFSSIVSQLGKRGLQCETFFLDATDATLLKRFSETRRKHPLSSSETPLNEAIIQERYLLEPISAAADLLIDTSQTNIHQLRDLIHNRVKDAGQISLSVLFESFGFKHGIPVDADFVFDIRCIPNPHWVPELRNFTGKDQAVINYLDEHDDVHEMYQDIENFISKWIPRFEADNRSYMKIAVGCTGGQHRSVYMVEKLASFFSQQRKGILSRHRELL